MARITIEDCIEQVPNRFHLVAMVSIRAKQLKKGATPLVSNEDNKEVVVALREIAAGHVQPDSEVSAAPVPQSKPQVEAPDAAPESGTDAPATPTEA